MSPLGRLKEGIREALLRTRPDVVKWLQRTKVKTAAFHSLRVEPELVLLEVLADPQRGAVDIGAHRGLYSSCLEPIVGNTGLYLFEPVPHLNAGLRRMFPHAFVSEAALSDGQGEATLRVPIEGRGLRLSRASIEPMSGASGRFKELHVPRAQLDDLVDEGTVGPIGLIKVDVEGHERHVLSGCTRILAEQKPVLIVEIEQRHHVRPIGEIVDWVCGFGYLAVIASPVLGRCLGRDEFRTDVHQSLDRFGTLEYLNNFLFIPETGAGETIERLNRVLSNRL